MHEKIYKIRLKNLRNLVKDRGGRVAFSKEANIGYNLLTQYIGKNPTINIGEEFARKVEASVNLHLGFLDTDLDNDSMIPFGTLVLCPIPGVNSVLANNRDNQNLTGDENKMLDQILMEKMQSMKLNANNAFWFTLKDETMEPYIEPGTLTMIDKGRRKIESGERYAVKINGQVSLRRIYIENGQYKVCCDNNNIKIKYPDRLIPDFNEEIQLIGKMVMNVLTY